jgi:hypothetical protein
VAQDLKPDQSVIILQLTICYATREIGQDWNNWGWQFEDEGLQSAHPFVETYGDSIFVVWQRKEGFYNYEEVYRGARHLAYTFAWHNLSQTPTTKSLYPVNANGSYTVYTDLSTPPINTWWEIFYKIRPGDTPYNISQTPYTWSHFPHSTAKFSGQSYLYTIWLDKPGAAYSIRFKKLLIPPSIISAYLTSNNGYETPSPYLIARDSFVSDWQIPVDIGYETITYQFLLEPGYRYKLKAIAYHESSGEWREWIKIDNKMKYLIKYDAYKPETLEFWIPPAFYKDGMIEVLLDRIKGDFAAIGPIYIYRYEYEEGEGAESGGPMAQESHALKSCAIAIFPNPFKEKLNIRYQTTDNNKVNLKIYDVTGRLVRSFNHLTNSPISQITWDSKNENGRVVAQGVYFVRIENLTSGDTFCRKIIKVR